MHEGLLGNGNAVVLVSDLLVLSVAPETRSETDEATENQGNVRKTLETEGQHKRNKTSECTRLMRKKRIVPSGRHNQYETKVGEMNSQRYPLTNRGYQRT